MKNKQFKKNLLLITTIAIYFNIWPSLANNDNRYIESISNISEFEKHLEALKEPPYCSCGYELRGELFKQEIGERGNIKVYCGYVKDDFFDDWNSSWSLLERWQYSYNYYSGWSGEWQSLYATASRRQCNDLPFYPEEDCPEEMNVNANLTGRGIRGVPIRVNSNINVNFNCQQQEEN